MGEYCNKLGKQRANIINFITPYFGECTFIRLHVPIKMMQYNGDGYRDYYLIGITDLGDLCYDSLCSLADRIIALTV